MEEDIKKETEKLLNQLKENNSKPENIYEYNTFVPNSILLPLYNVVDELINKNKEQEKIIELMSEKLAIYKFEEIICMETECEHIELQNEGKCIGDKECIIDYFKKKARDENV